MNQIPNQVPEWVQTFPMDDYDQAEVNVREDLAAIYHLLKKYRMTDLTNQYLSARLPGQDAYVTQYYGAVNEEITASNLVKVAMDGTNLEPEKNQPNPAGNIISKALFSAYPEINCIMHVHTKNIMAVSALEEGLQPLSQAYVMAGGKPAISYSRYEFECTDSFIKGIVDAYKDGQTILIESLHGAFVIGRTPAEAFFKTFYIDQACNVQLEAMATNRKLAPFSEKEQAQFLQEMNTSDWYQYDGSFEWPALRRICDRETPWYKY